MSGSTDPWLARLMHEGTPLRNLPQIVYRFAGRAYHQAATDEVARSATAAVSRLRALFRAWHAP